MLHLLSTYSAADFKKRFLTVAQRDVYYLLETNVGFLDERIIQAIKENMTKNLETKPAKKTSVIWLLMTKMSFQLFASQDETDYCSENHVNSIQGVNDTAGRGISVIKKFNGSVRDEQQK